MYKFAQLFFACLFAAFLASCEEVSDMAIDRVASPVLAVFGGEGATENLVSMNVTFYELDKSDILDQNVGIDSIPVANMAVTVYVNESVSLGEFTTNSNGEIFFEREMDALQGASRLEWVGTYKEVPFRIYRNL